MKIWELKTTDGENPDNGSFVYDTANDTAYLFNGGDYTAYEMYSTPEGVALPDLVLDDAYFYDTVAKIAYQFDIAVPEYTVLTMTSQPEGTSLPTIVADEQYFYQTDADVAYQYDADLSDFTALTMFATAESAIVPLTFDEGAVCYLTGDDSGLVTGLIISTVDAWEQLAVDADVSSVVALPTNTVISPDDDNEYFYLTADDGGDVKGLHQFDGSAWNAIAGTVAGEITEVATEPTSCLDIEGQVFWHIDTLLAQVTNGVWVTLEVDENIVYKDGTPALEDKRIIMANTEEEAQALYNEMLGDDASTVTELHTADYVIGLIESGIRSGISKDTCGSCGGTNIVTKKIFSDLSESSLKRNFYNVQCLSCYANYILLALEKNV